MLARQTQISNHQVSCNLKVEIRYVMTQPLMPYHFLPLLLWLKVGWEQGKPTGTIPTTAVKPKKKPSDMM